MDYKKTYFSAVLWCVISVVLTSVINILCLALHTDENHFWMLSINVLTGWLCGVFLVYFVSCRVTPCKELYRLSCRRRENISGVIDRIDRQPVRYERIACVTVYIGQRLLFAPEDMNLPQAGERAVFSVAGNVILEVTE